MSKHSNTLTALYRLGEELDDVPTYERRVRKIRTFDDRTSIKNGFGKGRNRQRIFDARVIGER